ncbi:MAG: hydrogenase maturation nickel metallochaperone HypA [Firmicutes bacterium]|nr:hydrogenase maturation nickel metallochaperone HypA [Bacillota bacterium]
MHEFGIMESVVEVVRQEAAKAGLRRVERVEMVVGERTAVLPDALEFAWEALRVGEPFAPGARLEVEWREARARCPACGREYHPEEGFLLVCPACGALGGELLAGEELLVASIEGE